MYLASPGDGIQARCVTAPMRKDFPFTWCDLLGVDCHHNTLATKLSGGFEDQVGVLDGGGIEGNFIGSGVKHGANILNRSQATADRQRHKNLIGRSLDHINHRLPLITRGRDIQKN